MTHRPEVPWRLDPTNHARADLAEDTMDLPPGWTGVTNCTLIGMQGRAIRVPLVLLHAEAGVALVGLPRQAVAEAEAALRHRLEAARFSAIFAGHLPVVALDGLPDDLAGLEAQLSEAFAKAPPLGVAGGDGWVGVVRRALLARASIRLVPPPPPDTEQPAPPVTAEPLPVATRRRRRGWVLPLAGLAGIGVLAGLAIGLTGTGMDPNSGAEVHPQPASSLRTGAGSNVAPPPAVAESAVSPVIPAQTVPAPTSPAPTSPAPTSPIQAMPAEAAPVRPAPPEPVPPEPMPSARSASSQPAPMEPPPPPPPPPAGASAPAPASIAVPDLPRVQVRAASNLRAGPDNGATILRVAPRGETFRVHGEAFGGWIQVGDAAPEGYIHSSLLIDAER